MNQLSLLINCDKKTLNNEQPKSVCEFIKNTKYTEPNLGLSYRNVWLENEKCHMCELIRIKLFQSTVKVIVKSDCNAIFNAALISKIGRELRKKKIVLHVFRCS